MKASILNQFLVFAIQNRLPVLIKGKPGIGKSDIVEQSCKLAGAKLIISHPVVSDPTDFKGLPFASKDGTTAHFLPFGDLNSLIHATEPTVFFLDDLGQASPSVQAACMQLLLARRINGHHVADYVTFIAATNRREDKAAVSGLLEPVKSRFASIIELDIDTEDWVKWALTHNQPTELISFIQFRPALLDNFQPTKDIVNSPCPRTVAAVGKLINAGLPQDLYFEAFKGAAGEAFATEFLAYLKVYITLPSVNSIILDPLNSPVPSEISGKFAISGAIAEKLTPATINPLLTYLQRLGKELTVSAFKSAAIKNPVICSTREFITWASSNSDLFL